MKTILLLGDITGRSRVALRMLSITSWEIDEETVETVSDFISGGSKITADGDHSHEIPSSQGYGFSSGHIWM